MKTLIVDGHNLIPKIPGLSLSQNDDETRLLELLTEFARLSRARMEIFFDGAPPAHARQSKGGLIHTHFIRKSSTADEAIIQFLRSQPSGREGVTVVSSDKHVMNEARRLGVAVKQSEVFAREMKVILNAPPTQQGASERALTEAEIDEWMSVFIKKE